MVTEPSAFRRTFKWEKDSFLLLLGNSIYLEVLMSRALDVERYLEDETFTKHFNGIFLMKWNDFTETWMNLYEEWFATVVNEERFSTVLNEERFTTVVNEERFATVVNEKRFATVVNEQHPNLIENVALVDI